jgi:hypothetical protein
VRKEKKSGIIYRDLFYGLLLNLKITDNDDDEAQKRWR